MAKLYSTEAAVTATRIATQVFGGNGFMEEYPVARFYRDAKILEIGEGTSRGAAAWSSPAAWACRHDATASTSPTRGSPTSAPGCTRPYETSGKITDKARAKLDRQNKLYVRDRIGLLFDEGSFVEDGRYANARPPGCRRTAWSPVAGPSTAGRRSSSPTTRP